MIFSGYGFPVLDASVKLNRTISGFMGLSSCPCEGVPCGFRGLGNVLPIWTQKGTKYMVFTRMMEGWKPTRCSQQSSADPNLFFRCHLIQTHARMFDGRGCKSENSHLNALAETQTHKSFVVWWLYLSAETHCPHLPVRNLQYRAFVQFRRCHNQSNSMWLCSNYNTAMSHSPLTWLGCPPRWKNTKVMACKKQGPTRGLTPTSLSRKFQRQ